MTRSIFDGNRGFGRRTRRAIRWTRWALTAERLARAFWPAVTIVLFTAAAALFGLFQHVEPVVHQALLAAAGLALLGALAVGLFRLRLPGIEDAARRLDRGDPSRPLSTLTDRLAVGRDDPRGTALWRAHVERAERASARLRASWPDLNLAPHDRWALRLFALTLLIGALIGAGAEWRERLWSAAEPGRLPELGQGVAEAPPAADAWATPPGYTGRDIVYLGDLAEGQPVPPLPEGSELTVRVTGFDGMPALDGSVLEGVEGFTSFGGGLAEARGVLTRSGDLGVTADGDELARWALTVIPDEPPAIEPAGDPLRAATGALEVPFRATDDYGVISAWVEIVPEGGLEPGRGLVSEPINFALPLPIARSAAEIEDSAIRDLSAHPWAGAEVEMVLWAEDGAEQRGRSETVRFVLPQRRFLNPLARALVEQRRELALDFASAERTLDILQAVTRNPEDIFEDNTGAYMGVRTAIRRLALGIYQDAVPQAAPEVADLLWLAAVSLEDGDLSDALARLRQAEQRLREALESGTDQEIADAIQALREAMEDYLQQLAQRAMENPDMQSQQMQPGQQLSQQDLQEMLDQIQRNAESGMRDQARDMLSQLSRMLENLQAGNPQMQQGGPAQQSLQELQELIQRQRNLADETFDALREQRRQQDGRSNDGGQPGERGMQQGQQGGMPGEQGQQQGQGEGQYGQRPGQQGRGMPGQGDRGNRGDLAAQQRALEQALDQLMQGLPGGPDNPANQSLDGAGQAMGEATSDLQRDSAADAVQDQMEALDRLNEGADALAQQIQDGQGDTAAQGNRRGNQGQAQDALRTDPFDRPAGSYGAIDGRDTDVPDRSALDRAREVLEELRRRAAEPGRQQLELDYFDRLMNAF